jgi:hypothetical protein
MTDDDRASIHGAVFDLIIIRTVQKFKQRSWLAKTVTITLQLQ